MKITLLTFVSGNINRVDFCASGSGYAQYNQVIYSSAKVRRIEPNFQVVISRFDGLCKGEVNIVKMLPYQEILIPQGKGKAIFRGERVVITNKGSEIKIRWDDNYIL
jgi:hypothetical protein